MELTEPSQVDSKLAEILSGAPNTETFRALLALLEEAHGKWPEQTSNRWIQHAERAVLEWTTFFGISYDWIESYVKSGQRYPMLRLFKQVSVEGAYETPDGLRRIFSHPDLCHVEVISWPSGNLYNEGTSALIESVAPDRLRVLDLQDNRIGDDGAEALANSGKLSRLTHLGLFRNHLDRRGLRAIVQSGGLGALQMLSVGYQNTLSHEALSEELADAPGLGRLRELRVEHSDLDDDDMTRLANAPGVSGLGAIYLTGNPVTERGLRALRASPHTGTTRIVR